MLAGGLQLPEGPIAMSDGSVLATEITAGTLARVSPDGHVERIAKLGGGPNGAAIGPTALAATRRASGISLIARRGNAARSADAATAFR